MDLEIRACPASRISKMVRLVRHSRYFQIDSLMRLLVAIRLLIIRGRSPCEPWLRYYFCAGQQSSVKSCQMPRPSRVPIKPEPLTCRSGSPPELTAHPSLETPLRDHFGSGELQLARGKALWADFTEPTPPLPAQAWLWPGSLRLPALPATSSRNITSTSESFGSGNYPSLPEPTSTATTSLIILRLVAKPARLLPLKCSQHENKLSPSELALISFPRRIFKSLLCFELLWARSPQPLAARIGPHE